MLRCITYITITQQPRQDYPNRKNVLNFDFCHEFESSDSWRDLTNKGKITLPKNIFYRNQYNQLISLAKNVNIGGFSSQDPLIMRGDKVSIEAGYRYFNSANQEITETNIMHTGYVSKVNSKIPIQLEIEDNMWICKQTPVDTRTFGKNETLEVIISHLISLVNKQWGTSLSSRPLTTTTFGNFTMGNETVAQVLQRLQKQYGFESYFRGDELRSGVIIYVEAEAKTERFYYEQNIISDNLEYERKDDITLSAVAHNTIDEATGDTTKDGQAKTKRKRLEVLITVVNGKTLTRVINKGDVVPENTDGERHTFFFPGAKTTQDLIDLAIPKLQQYYYTGLRGKFTTFGLPFVRQGDNAIIKSPKMPEVNGMYKIKAVDYKGGVNGLRQEVSLDYKLNVNV